MKSYLKKFIKKSRPQIRVNYPTGHHTIEDLQILRYKESHLFIKRSVLKA